MHAFTGVPRDGPCDRLLLEADRIKNSVLFWGTHYKTSGMERPSEVPITPQSPYLAMELRLVSAAMVSGGIMGAMHPQTTPVAGATIIGEALQARAKLLKQGQKEVLRLSEDVIKSLETVPHIFSLIPRVKRVQQCQDFLSSCIEAQHMGLMDLEQLEKAKAAEAKAREKAAAAAGAGAAAEAGAETGAGAEAEGSTQTARAKPEAPVAEAEALRRDDIARSLGTGTVASGLASMLSLLVKLGTQTMSPLHTLFSLWGMGSGSDLPRINTMVDRGITAVHARSMAEIAARVLGFDTSLMGWGAMGAADLPLMAPWVKPWMSQLSGMGGAIEIPLMLGLTVGLEPDPAPVSLGPVADQANYATPCVVPDPFKALFYGSGLLRTTKVIRTVDLSTKTDRKWVLADPNSKVGNLSPASSLPGLAGICGLSLLVWRARTGGGGKVLADPKAEASRQARMSKARLAFRARLKGILSLVTVKDEDVETPGCPEWLRDLHTSLKAADTAAHPAPQAAGDEPVVQGHVAIKVRAYDDGMPPANNPPGEKKQRDAVKSAGASGSLMPSQGTVGWGYTTMVPALLHLAMSMAPLPPDHQLASPATAESTVLGAITSGEVKTSPYAAVAHDFCISLAEAPCVASAAYIANLQMAVFPGTQFLASVRMLDLAQFGIKFWSTRDGLLDSMTKMANLGTLLGYDEGMQMEQARLVTGWAASARAYKEQDDKSRWPLVLPLSLQFVPKAVRLHAYMFAKGMGLGQQLSQFEGVLQGLAESWFPHAETDEGGSTGLGPMSNRGYMGEVAAAAAPPVVIDAAAVKAAFVPASGADVIPTGADLFDLRLMNRTDDQDGKLQQGALEVMLLAPQHRQEAEGKKKLANYAGLIPLIGQDQGPGRARTDTGTGRILKVGEGGSNPLVEALARAAEEAEKDRRQKAAEIGEEEVEGIPIGVDSEMQVADARLAEAREMALRYM
jgi:hypothetical protein